MVNSKTFSTRNLLIILCISLLQVGCGSMPVPPLADNAEPVFTSNEISSDKSVKAIVDIEPELVGVHYEDVPDNTSIVEPEPAMALDATPDDEIEKPVLEKPPEPVAIVEEKPAPPPLVQKIVEQPKYSANEYVNQAIGYLHRGDKKQARDALEFARRVKPLHATASMLMSHLDTEPQRLLGDTYREYTMRQGDTLSELAERHLGDSLKFYVLARYNNIENPSLVRVGQMIRIPVYKESFEPRYIPSTLEISSVTNPVLKTAAEFLKAKRYEKVIATVNSNPRSLSFLSTPEAQLKAQIVASASIGHALHLQRENKLFAAQAVLGKARQQYPRIIELQFHQETVEREIEIRQLTQSAETAAEQGREKEAIIALNKILELDPAHNEAKESLDAIQLSMADDLYRRALIAQHNQKLDLAIVLWEQFFTIMPDNENAKLYYKKAKRMSAQLKRVAQQ